MAHSTDSRRSPCVLLWRRAILNYGRIALWCGLLTLTTVAGGCQRGPTWNLAPVEGTVTKDGRPLAHIEVIFLPDLDAGTQGLRSRGTTDEVGHYRLRTVNGDDGTVVGKHRVVLLDLEAAGKQTLQKNFRGPLRKGKSEQSLKMAKRLEELEKKAAEGSRVPPSYSSFNDTPLRVEVHPGPQVIDLEVK